MKRFVILSLLLLGVGPPLTARAQTATARELDSLLNVLERQMAQRSAYDSAKEQRLSQLKALLNDGSLPDERLLAINSELVERYEAYVFDSAIVYVNASLAVARRIGDARLIDRGHLQLAHLLTISGRYKEAFDVLADVDRSQLQGESLYDYYQSYKKGYGDLSFYTRIPDNFARYSRQAQAYRDSLQDLLEPGTERYLRLVEERLLDERQLAESRKVNDQRLAMSRSGERAYSLAAFQRSLSYELEGDTPNRKKYLILSAISDIEGSVKDNASLATLALLLFKEDDIERAYRYINFAFEDATFFNSRLRFLEISSVLPLIDEAYQLESERQNARLRRQLWLISALMAAVLAGAGLIYWQMRRISRNKQELTVANERLNHLNAELSATNARLQDLYGDLYEANHVKEQYIGSFLNICSEFIDKLEEQQNLVKRLVTARKFSQILDKIKSNELIKREVKEFYANFDAAFLNIYPDFVKQFNALLRPQEAVALKDGERLNTELRIFALVRLGIEESADIARLLRYSVNTIYNYRARIKNRASGDRDSFEEEVKKIGAFRHQQGP